MEHGITTVKQLRTTYILFALFINVLVTMYMIINDDNSMEEKAQYAHYFRFLYCAIWSICATWYLKDKIRGELKTHIIKSFVLFTITTCVSLCITHIGNILQLASNLLLFATPCLTIMGCYSYGYRYGKENSTFYLIALTILACAVSYVSIYMTYNVLGERGHFGVAYYALYLLPLILATDKRWIRIISIVVISVIIISSVKRGGLLALALGMFVYLYVSRLVADKSVKSSIVLYVYLIIMAAFLFFLIQYLGDDIVERFLDSDDDTGSGRLDIWESLYRRLKTQDITFWIFGNGHLATTVYSWENLTAHNDFLEILYNYGLFNLLIYVSFIFSAIAYTIRAIRQKSKLAPCLAMFLTIFLILSTISIIILSHTCTLSMITLGFLIGWNEYDKKQQQVLE